MSHLMDRQKINLTRLLASAYEAIRKSRELLDEPYFDPIRDPWPRAQRDRQEEDSA